VQQRWCRSSGSMPPSSSNTRGYLQLRRRRPDVDEVPASFRSAQNAVTVHRTYPLLTNHVARLQANPMGRAGRDWNTRTKGPVSNQSRLMASEHIRYTFSDGTTKALTAGASLTPICKIRSPQPSVPVFLIRSVFQVTS